MVTTKAVKSTALVHLRGNWGRVCTVAMIPVFATIAVLLMGYLLTLPFGVIIGDAIAVMVFVFLCAPLWLGALRVFWRTANGCDDSPAETFYYFTLKKEYMRSLSFNLKVAVHWVVVEFILFLPAILTYIFTSGTFFQWIGASTPLLLVNLRYLIYVFEIAAVVLTVVHLTSLYLPAFLFVSNEEMKPRECINRGIQIGKYTKGRFWSHLLGFSGWIVFSLMFIPMLFTVPYLLMSYVVECRYNVAFYNLSGKAALDAPMLEV